MPRSKHTPSYRLHKPTGQAVVTIGGRDHYLGAHGTQESHDRYNRLIAEWFARGQQLPPRPASAGGITVAQLALAYLKHADAYYRRPDGTVTGEHVTIRCATRPLLRLYSRLLVAEFSPLKLRAVRAEMVTRGWARTRINHQVGRIRRMFKWGVSQEMLPGTVLHDLEAVDGLRAGRSDAQEPAPVKPVPDGIVDAVLPFVSRQVQTMIELQLVTGMRPAEVCMMRTCDIVTAENVWAYTPPTHKTAHHGHARVIYLGPRGQELLRPWLRAPAHRDRFLFSPADAEAERIRATLKPADKYRSPSHAARMNRRLRRPRKRKAGDRYTVASYRRAIQHGCDRAFELPADLAAMLKDVREWAEKWRQMNGGCRPRRKEMPSEVREKRDAVEAFRAAHRWHPHQLRHNAATDLRAQFGLEAARVVLGHRTAAVTEIYAEIDQEKAAKIMGDVG
jgi:integrase